MTETKFVETACFGNNGRSPLQELLIRNYLKERKVLGEYEARSSGTGVAKIFAGQLPSTFKISMIQRAINERSDLNMYSPTEISDIEAAIKDGNDEVITNYFNRAQDVFKAEERTYRQEVLPMFGIEGTVKEAQEQTVVQSDTVAFFGMDQKVLSAAQQIYTGADQPQIMDIGIRYATGDQNAQIPNTFGQKKDVYVKMIEVQRDITPKMVDRMLNEL